MPAEHEPDTTAEPDPNRPPLPARPEWVGTEYVAALLGRHPQTVRQWAARGLIPMPKVMGRRMMHRDDLHALLRGDVPE